MRDGQIKRAVEILEADGFDMRWATGLDEAVETIIERRQAARAELTTAGQALVRADKEVTKLRAALTALVNQIDAVQGDADYQYHWSMAFVHAGSYKGPHYADELKAAREVLAMKTDQIARCKGCGKYLELDQTHHGSHVVDRSECGPVEWVDREKPAGMP